MARPSISVGRGVKIFDKSVMGGGRQDATCTKVNNSTGIIEASTAKSKKAYRNVRYRDDCTDADNVCWVELPSDFTAGSLGN